MILRFPFGTRFLSWRRAVAAEPADQRACESAAAQDPDRVGDTPPLTGQSPSAHDPPEALLPGCGLTMKQVDQQLHFADGLPVTYVQNYKAGCTSIKFSLLLSMLPSERISDSALHWRGEGPFARLLSACAPEEIRTIVGRPIFTMVRNPFLRILSGYLDKARLSQPQGRAFYGRYFLRSPPDEPIGFVHFLRCVASDHPRACNPHFAPQYVNTVVHHIDYDFLGSVEDIDAMAAFLRGHGIDLEPWRYHATGAAGLVEAHFTAEAEGLVEEIFAEDFRLFGYPRGLARAHEPPVSEGRAPRRGVALADFVADPQECAQPEAPEVDAMRRFHRSRDLAERRAIALRGATFDDWRAVKVLAKAMIEANLLDLAYPLLDRLTVLLTQHMEHVPERLLSEQGRTLRRRRDAILAR